VEIAATAPEMIASAEALLSRPRAPWLARVDGHLAHLSWDNTWNEMHALMRRKLDAPAATNIPAVKTQVQEAVHV
jgi:hypothetical protein